MSWKAMFVCTWSIFLFCYLRYNGAWFYSNYSRINLVEMTCLLRLYMTGFRMHHPRTWHWWHLEYFKLKGFETKGQVLWGLWPPPSALKQVLGSSGGKCPPCTWRKGASSSPRIEGFWEESEWTGFAKFPHFTTLGSFSFVLSLFPWLFTVHPT